MSVRCALTLLLTALTLTGCGGTADTPAPAPETEEPTSESTTSTETTPPAAETKRDSAFVVTDEIQDTGDNDGDAQEEELILGNPAPTTETDQTAEPTLEKADVGAGEKGRGYGGDPITEPAKQYFAIRERTVFQIQIPQALNMYKALNGKLPKDHEEFMSKVVKENNISLPELPEGKTYLYDAEQGELMIQTGGEEESGTE